MKRPALIACACLGLCLAATLVTRSQGQPGTGGSGEMLRTPAPPDAYASERDSLSREVLKAIAGREEAPAESVFKNIKVWKGVPASRIPRIMNMGYGRSLGVSCSHCHVVGHWDAEDSTAKQVARDMSAMVDRINKELLPAIPHLRGQRPAVNCTTCHRGSVKPALNF